MGSPSHGLLDCCLYFTANSLSRVITRMAEESFGAIAMSPSHAFLLMLAIEKPGISQKELAEALHLAPSTVSRFVDALVRRKLVEKRVEGRSTLIRPTENGMAMGEPVGECWRRLYERYSEILGKENGDELNRLTREACAKLEKGF